MAGSGSMKLAFYTNSISPHQLPLSMELVSVLGCSDYCYIYTNKSTEERKRLGWPEASELWLKPEYEHPDEARRILETAEVVISTLRDIHLFEKRAQSGMTTIYTSERWFKPPVGLFRILCPSFFWLSWRLVSLLKSSAGFYYYPMGVHAAQDMARLCGLFSGDLRCFFGGPKIICAKQPCARINVSSRSKAAISHYCVDKMRLWGYFVEPSSHCSTLDGRNSREGDSTLRVLWVGRLLNWKRVDTIIKAVLHYAEERKTNQSLPRILLDIYGTGPEYLNLMRLASSNPDVVHLHEPVPIKEVRSLMREHDVYVLSSNGQEGWGAVLNEALEENMRVIGTAEAGSSATILPESNIFKAGDWERVLSFLSGDIPDVQIGAWTPKVAADSIVRELNACSGHFTGLN